MELSAVGDGSGESSEGVWESSVGGKDEHRRCGRKGVEGGEQGGDEYRDAVGKDHEAIDEGCSPVDEGCEAAEVDLDIEVGDEHAEG